jgi:hypothetical protein
MVLRSHSLQSVGNTILTRNEKILHHIDPAIQIGVEIWFQPVMTEVVTTNVA